MGNIGRFWVAMWRRAREPRWSYIEVSLYVAVLYVIWRIVS